MKLLPITVFDDPEHISGLMNLTGAVCAVAVPRFFFIDFSLYRQTYQNKKGRAYQVVNQYRFYAISVGFFNNYFWDFVWQI